MGGYSEEMKEYIREITGSWTEREKRILEDRLIGDQPRSFREIGEDFGVTASAIQQSENRMIGRLARCAHTTRNTPLSALADEAEKQGTSVRRLLKDKSPRSYQER